MNDPAEMQTDDSLELVDGDENFSTVDFGDDTGGFSGENGTEVDAESGHVLIEEPGDEASAGGEVPFPASGGIGSEPELTGSVLVVDDNESLLRVGAVAALRAAGFEVFEAGNVADTIQHFNANKIAVILHNWSTVNGSEAVQMHRQLIGSPGSESVVRIFLTSDGSPEFFALACDLEVDKVLDAGIEPTDLPEVVRICLGSKSDDLNFTQLVGNAGLSSNYDEQMLDERIVRIYSSRTKSRRIQLEFGSYLVRCAKLEEAEQLASELTESYPQDPRCMNFLARIYMKQRRYGRAVETLKRADVISPDNPERLVLIGDALFERGEFGEAKKSYEEAISIDPTTPGAHRGLGRSLLSLGELDAALSCFRKCLSEDETASFFNNAAVLAVKSSRIDEGLRLYETALRALKTDKYTHIILFNTALALYRTGEFQRAAETVRASLGYRPDFEKSKRLLDGISAREAG